MWISLHPCMSSVAPQHDHNTSTCLCKSACWQTALDAKSYRTIRGRWLPPNLSRREGEFCNTDLKLTTFFKRRRVMILDRFRFSACTMCLTEYCVVGRTSIRTRACIPNCISSARRCKLHTLNSIALLTHVTTLHAIFMQLFTSCNC